MQGTLPCMQLYSQIDWIFPVQRSLEGSQAPHLPHAHSTNNYGLETCSRSKLAAAHLVAGWVATAMGVLVEAATAVVISAAAAEVSSPEGVMAMVVVKEVAKAWVVVAMTVTASQAQHTVLAGYLSRIIRTPLLLLLRCQAKAAREAATASQRQLALNRREGRCSTPL